MANEVDFPSNQPRDTTTITDGFFEREVYLSGAETASFLRTLADAVEDGDELLVSGDDWEIPFEFTDPIEVEIEFSNRSKRELEIELEFEEPKSTEGGLNIE
jgi:amphi-Trp domain-containing protein